MPHDPCKLLHDVLDSCRFLTEFSAGRTCEDLRNNRGFRSAVERELQIIGEAAMMLAKTSPEVAKRISEYQRIIRFRHILVHGYDVLDCDITWTIVCDKVPVLADEVEHLLREMP